MIGIKDDTKVVTKQSVSSPLCMVFVIINLIMILGTVATLFEISNRYEYGTGKPSIISICDACITAGMDKVENGTDFSTVYQAEIEKHLQYAVENVQEDSPLWDWK